MYRSLKNMNAASGITQLARDMYMINTVFIKGDMTKKYFVFMQSLIIPMFNSHIESVKRASCS